MSYKVFQLSMIFKGIMSEMSDDEYTQILLVLTTLAAALTSLLL